MAVKQKHHPNKYLSPSRTKQICFEVLRKAHILTCCNVCLSRLWDMVDEFIYQFQSFAQYRGKLAQKSPHELELLKKCDGVWDLQGVLHYLQGLIDKSGVVRELASDGQCVNCSIF